MGRPESKPARILMVTERFYPDWGGTERQLQLLAKTLAGRGLVVEIVTPRTSKRHTAHEIVQGIPVHRLPFLRVRRLATVTTLLSLMYFLIHHARQFDVFHVHTIDYLAVVSTLMGRLMHKKVILKAVGWWELKIGFLSTARRSRLVTWLSLAILRRADIWVAISRELEQAMLAAGVAGHRIRTLWNGVDLARYAPGSRTAARQGLRMAIGDPRILFVGRLVPEKGLFTLLRAWSRVTEKIPAAHLDIVGSGALRMELEDEARRLEIASQVTFYGEQSDVVSYLQAADGFVLPSTVEGMSNALLEAMAMALPIVASRIAGIEGVLEDRVTGLLVTPDDPDELARALATVLQDPNGSKELGRRAHARVQEAYAIERIAEVYVQMYRRTPPPADVGYLLSLFPCWSETFILREILALRDRGVSIQIFSLRRPSETFVQEAAKGLLDHVIYCPPLWRVTLSQLSWISRRPWRWLGAVAGAFREAAPRGAREIVKALYTVAVAAHFSGIARTQDIDHIHAHWATYPALAARIMRKLTGMRYTFTAHAHDIFLPNPYLKGNIAHAHRIVTISEYNRRRLLSAGAKHDALTVIPCGLDLREFSALQRRRQDPPSIVAVGRLEPIKGFRYLIEACALLRQRDLEFVCHIVGDGSLREDLRTKIEALDLEDRIRLLGALDSRRVRDVLAAATVFALPSIRTPSGDQDGVPVALMEAMATGLPVVSTRLSGIPTLVSDGISGLLVEPADATALADAVERLLNDDALGEALGSQARAVIWERHDVRASAEQLRTMFFEAGNGS